MAGRKGATETASPARTGLGSPESAPVALATLGAHPLISRSLCWPPRALLLRDASER